MVEQLSCMLPECPHAYRQGHRRARASLPSMTESVGKSTGKHQCFLVKFIHTHSSLAHALLKIVAAVLGTVAGRLSKSEETKKKNIWAVLRRCKIAEKQEKLMSRKTRETREQTATERV